MSEATLAEMIAGSFRTYHEGSIVKGRILEIKPQIVLVDIGYKSEGAIPSSEFEDEEIQVGDEVVHLQPHLARRLDAELEIVLVARGVPRVEIAIGRVREHGLCSLLVPALQRLRVIPH